MVELFQTIFGDVQTWFYTVGLFYMVGFPVYWFWQKILMRKKCIKL